MIWLARCRACTQEHTKARVSYAGEISQEPNSSRLGSAKLKIKSQLISVSTKQVATIKFSRRADFFTIHSFNAVKLKKKKETAPTFYLAC